MYKISPAYFSDIDLINEYKDLYCLVLWVNCATNKFKGNNCKKLVTSLGSCLSCPKLPNDYSFGGIKFHKEELLFFDYAIKNIYAEIQFRNIDYNDEFSYRICNINDIEQELKDNFYKVDKLNIEMIWDKYIKFYNLKPSEQFKNLKNKYKTINYGDIKYEFDNVNDENSLNIIYEKNLKINSDYFYNSDKILSDYKFSDKKIARITVPDNSKELWQHHKYSIMARDVNLYKSIGREVAVNNSSEYFDELCLILTSQLTYNPKNSGILNSLQHMWGYISEFSNVSKSQVDLLSLKELFLEIQRCVKYSKQEYLYNQIAISELGTWIRKSSVME